MKRLSALGMILALAVNLPAMGDDEPDLRNWKNFPVPHDIPKTDRPSDAELLDVLPPLRKPPVFSDESRDLGVAYGGAITPNFSSWSSRRHRRILNVRARSRHRQGRMNP